MARDVTSYHSHSDVLTFSVEMDRITCMVAKDTKNSKYTFLMASAFPTSHVTFPSYKTISNNNDSGFSPFSQTPTHVGEITM